MGGVSKKWVRLFFLTMADQDSMGSPSHSLLARSTQKSILKTLFVQCFYYSVFVDYYVSEQDMRKCFVLRCFESIKYCVQR